MKLAANLSETVARCPSCQSLALANAPDFAYDESHDEVSCARCHQPVVLYPLVIEPPRAGDDLPIPTKGDS